MNINLTPKQEEIINQQLKAGHFRTAQEVIDRALETLRANQNIDMRVRDRASVANDAAVAAMLAFVEKNSVRLTGISVKDLIHEGHRL